MATWEVSTEPAEQAMAGHSVATTRSIAATAAALLLAAVPEVPPPLQPLCTDEPL